MAENPPAPLRASYWVLPGRLLAGEYPGELDPEATRKRLRCLLAAGIRTFVDLTDQGEVNPGYRAILRALAEEEAVQVTYANIPIEDRRVPSPWTMRCILDVIDRSLADENPVYLHCWAGRGRTGTVVGCYLKRHGLVEGRDVIAKLAELRRHASNGNETSPDTQEQLALVVNWKKGL